MSNNKKTAVDSIIEFCQELLGNHYSISHDGVCAVIQFCQQQAKEMEMEQNKITENTSDGYHTFKELYEIRKAYNVALFNEWGRIVETLDPYGRRFGMYEELVKDNHVADKYFLNALSSKIKSVPMNYVHKSRRHHDGELPFGKDDWFIVCAMLPTGQISNHYPIEDWDLFKIPEVEKALFPFDGHTTEDVISRLINFLGLK